MKLGVHIVGFDFPGGAAAIGAALARAGEAAEQAGIDNLSVMDHYLQIAGDADGTDARGIHHARLPGRAHLDRGAATACHRGHLPAPRVACQDRIDPGRAIRRSCAPRVGAAWYEREHAALGVPFPPLKERFERLEETLQIVLQMWGESNAPYDGKHYQLAETLNSPQPLSRPHPPIMVGGGGEKKTLRLVARYGDACNLFADPHRGSPQAIRAKLDVLRDHCVSEGADYDRIRKSVLWLGPLETDPDGGKAFVEQMAAYAETGVDEVHVMPHGDDPANFISRLGEHVTPLLDDLR